MRDHAPLAGSALYDGAHTTRATLNTEHDSARQQLQYVR